MAPWGASNRPATSRLRRASSVAAILLVIARSKPTGYAPRMTHSPTVSALLETMVVTNHHVDSAIAAYFADPRRSAHPIANGYTLDLAAAVEERPWVSEVVSDAEADPDLKRGVVRTAILLARAQKA